MSKKFGIQTKGTGRAVMQGGGAARSRHAFRILS